METLAVGLVSGVVGGVLVQVARILFDSRMERRSRSREASEEFLRRVATLRRTVTLRIHVRGTEKSLQDRQGWWRPISDEILDVSEEWLTNWILKLPPRRINRVVFAVFKQHAITVAAEDEADFYEELATFNQLLIQLESRLRREILGSWRARRSRKFMRLSML
jgi:hypothetical protein